MAKSYVLALDLGTTGNRAIVFDASQRIVAQAYEEFPQVYPRPGWVEHDAQKIWKSTRNVIAQILKRVPANSIAAVGVTNQRETVLLWDRVSGKPVHNAIVWQCRRTAPLCEQLKKKGLGEFIRRKTGLTLDPYFSASKISWILEHVPLAKTLARQGRLMAGTIDTWIIWNLSARRAHVTDSSNASRTMLFNIHSLCWDDSLCRIFGVPMEILPGVVPSSHVSAVTDARIFGREIPIAGIVGDQQGAAFAQGLFSPGMVKNTYGTGLFALENTGKTPCASKNLLTTVVWSLGDLKNTEYAVEGSVFIAGAAIQWLRDGLGLLKKASESEAMARKAESNGGVYFVPALVGLGAPHWDAHARGTVLGITRGTRKEHLVRAALEASAYQTREILDVMKNDTGLKLKALRVDGGACANDFLMQFQADILDVPVERPRVFETTALGAAGLAGLAVSYWKNRVDFNRKRKVERVFYPKMSKTMRERLYSEWKKAVSRSLSWTQ